MPFSSSPDQNTVKPKQYIGLLLLQKFSLASMASCTEFFAQVNRLLERDSYEVILIAETGTTVSSSCGVSVTVDVAMRSVGVANLSYAPALNTLLVLSASPLPQRGFDDVIAWLRAAPNWLQAPMPTATNAAQNSANTARVPALGGIGTGAYLLARAGLLNGSRATIDWTYASLFAEDFPAVVVSSNL